MNEIDVFASALAAAACPPMLKAPRTVLPDASVSGNGPAGPWSPLSPFGPCGPGGPAGPAGTWPALKSFLSSDPSFTFGDVTALFLSWGVPTLLLGSAEAA